MHDSSLMFELDGPRVIMCTGNGQWEPDPRNVEWKGTDIIIKLLEDIQPVYVYLYQNLTHACIQCRYSYTRIMNIALSFILFMTTNISFPFILNPGLKRDDIHDSGIRRYFLIGGL